MSITGSMLDWLRLRYIHIVSRRELQGIFSIRYLIVIERKVLFRLPPRAIGEHCSRAVVGMVINWPVGKDRVRLFGRKYFCVLLIMRVVYHRMAVYLSRIGRPGFQYFACLASFGDSRGGGSGRPSAVIQIQQNYLVPKCGVASDGAAAAVFRITRMAAGYHHLQFATRGRLCLSNNIDHRNSKGQGGSHAAGGNQQISSGYSHLATLFPPI